jgi:hypothetical protein
MVRALSQVRPLPPPPPPAHRTDAPSPAVMRPPWGRALAQISLLMAVKETTEMYVALAMGR